ncbi:hypothetical protein HYH02_006015 [Chlamydomonas schloesseri]|uniref:PB1 domain-containing protein n=1 Tax=Chlamydomonas schloesseri TaxID=2026947 RepID=A0A836B696_9CHLO|nr:hypothetical protein HYH02_006015 [Chlamydomonas schloesseri]|eukprot:KAG2448658.1 hypothetical protein HYH02_006015 [Chlamydomonas schloesseri]
MAKTKSKSPAKPAPAAPANLDAEVAKKFVELKTEGNQAFARGDYAKALNVYEDAIKLLPTNAPERADIYNNKAACFIGQKRYKEAVKECTSALEVAPNSVRALQRRAKAFEQQGLFKEALADVTAINKTDLASPETQEQERRLREAAARGGAAAAARPRSAVAAGARGAGAAAAGAGAAAAQNNKLQNLLQQGVFVAKATLGDDTKLVHLSLSNSYADVLAAVQLKFPSAGPFLLKYVDKNGDLITLTCKADMHVALGELVQQYQRQVQGQGAHGPKLTSFPPLKLIVQPCAEADVPKPPVEEELERAQMMAMQKAQLAAAQAKVAEAGGAAEPEAAHMDSWIMDFAQLFVQQTGLEPDKHIDLHNMGWDAVTKALDNTLHAEAAAPLFAKARDSFRDVAATGLTGWGQVHQLQGNRLLEAAGRAGKKLEEVKAAVEAEFAEAEKRYTEALSYSPDFFDAAANMCQLVFERAKLAAGLMPAPEPEKKADGEANGKDAGKGQEQVAAEQAEAAAAATKAALASLTAAGVEGAKALYGSAMTWADKAVALAPKHDEAQAARVAEGSAAAAGANPGEFSFKAQALVLKGNFMYEWSQMLAAVGRAESEWRSELDAAQALFREAGCPEKDIRTALRNHLKAPELNIPAEEEEPAAKEAAEAKPAAKEEPAEEKPKAKGLPSLEVKKAKK